MPVRQYATAEQYATWLDVPSAPAGADRLLVAASEIVDEMMLTSVYDVDSVTTLPTDTDQAETIQRATCAQAEFMSTDGDTGAVGISPTGAVSSFTLGKMSVTKSARAADTRSANSSIPSYWAPRAWRILTQGQLTNQAPWGT